MKKNILSLFAFCFTTSVYSQNVAIGTATAPELLTVNGTTLIDASNLNVGTFSGGRLLKFGTVGGVGIGSNKGTGATGGGIDFFTNGSSRFSIDSSGNVSIGMFPSITHKLAVNGNSIVHGQSIIAQGVGIGTTTPNLTNYILDVNGRSVTRQDARFEEDVIVVGKLIVDNRSVIRSISTSPQLLVYASGSFMFTNAPAGHTTDITFAFPNSFSSAPRISVANLSSGTGTFERWVYTVHSINMTNHSFQLRVFNAGSSPSTMTATLNFIIAGPEID